MRTTARKAAATALGFTLTVGCAACATGDGSAAPAAAPAQAGSTGPIAAVSDRTALEFVGGKAGAADRSLPAVRIGYLNQDTGVPSFPEATVAVKAAVAYVDATLGGVQGHPVELVTCQVASEAQGQSCAQRMLNDATIAVVQTGAMVVGNASVYNTINGAKPILGGNPTAPADFTAKNTYFFTPGAPGVNGAIADYIANTLKATSASVVHSDDPGGSTAGKIGADALRAAGLKTTDVAFPSGGGDLTAPLLAAGAQSAPAIDFLAAGPACLQMAQAQKQLALKATIFSASLCLDPSVRKALGDFAPWYYGSSTPNVYIDGDDPQVNLYRSVMSAAGGADVNVGGFAPLAFGSLLDLVKVMNSIGYAKLSPATIGSALAAYTGPAFLGAPDIACDKASETPTVCTPSARILKYDGGGRWSDPTGGTWLRGR